MSSAKQHNIDRFCSYIDTHTNLGWSFIASLNPKLAKLYDLFRLSALICFATMAARICCTTLKISKVPAYIDIKLQMNVSSLSIVAFLETKM